MRGIQRAAQSHHGAGAARPSCSARGPLTASLPEAGDGEAPSRGGAFCFPGAELTLHSQTPVLLCGCCCVGENMGFETKLQKDSFFFLLTELANVDVDTAPIGRLVGNDAHA